MVHIIDYGVGNIQAFLNVYKQLGIAIEVACSKKDIDKATHLILPGVGAFDQAMKLFNDSGLRDSVERQVLEYKTPVMGICVGMQMLATSSEEGRMAGLGWILGKVRAFHSHSASANLPMPHMGWNNVVGKRPSILLKGFADSVFFYFLHSFYYECENGQDVIATAEYGHHFDCIIGRDNIFGIQCHPEKSHSAGSRLLNNFAEIPSNA